MSAGAVGGKVPPERPTSIPGLILGLQKTASQREQTPLARQRVASTRSLALRPMVTTLRNRIWGIEERNVRQAKPVGRGVHGSHHSAENAVRLDREFDWPFGRASSGTKSPIPHQE